MKGVTVSDDIQVGDKVRLTVEGEVTRVYAGGAISVKGAPSSIPPSWSDHLEVVEKKVTTFKPGDVVRGKRAPHYVYTIGKGGFLAHRYGHAWIDAPGYPFTSENYELVTLHESPF